MISRRTLLVAAGAALVLPAVARAASPLRGIVGFAQDTSANDWRVAQVRDVQQGLAGQAGVSFLHTDAGGQLARQIVDIERLAPQVDVLITSPLDPVAMAPVIAAIEAKGKPVILLSRRVEGEAFTSFVHADNHAIGRQAGRFIAERLNGKGRVVVLQHIPTTTPAIGRTEGFFEVIKEYPDITVVTMRRADSLRAKAIQVMEEIISEGLAFDAVYAQSDSMAAGARLALKKAGVDLGSLVTVGIDYITEARNAILAGEQTASFTYPTFGKEGAALALKLLARESVPKYVTVQSELVTRDNAEQVPPIF